MMSPGQHPRNEAVVDMQVGAADRSRGDADDGITRIQDLRIGDILDAQLLFAVPDICFHTISASVAARQAPAARRATDHAAPSRGLTVGGGDLACFQQLFETTQILLDPGLWVLAQAASRGRR